VSVGAATILCMLRLTGLVCILLLAVSTLAGCAATPEPAVELPAGVTVNVYQTRTDLAARQLEVSVHNGSDDELTITGLVFEGDQFTEPAVWQRDQTSISAGLTADLPVPLAAPDCEATGTGLRVQLDFALADGRSGSASIEATDEVDRMPRLAFEDCLAAEVAAHAQITATTLPRSVTIGSRLVAELDLAVEPTGAPGSITVDEALGTTLLGLADPVTGSYAEAQSLGITIDEQSAASVITLQLVPNRCDAHAVMEDKRGTVLPLRVTTDEGESGIVYVTTPDDVKAALFAYVAAACG
jgi:hypothetical protein